MVAVIEVDGNGVVELGRWDIVKGAVMSYLLETFVHLAIRVGVRILGDGAQASCELVQI